MYTDQWSLCPISLPSSTVLHSNGSIATAGCLPHQQQPPCNVWTGGFESTWKTGVSSVVLPWWKVSDQWITPSAKLQCDPVLSADQQHLKRCVKVIVVIFIVWNGEHVMTWSFFHLLQGNCVSYFAYCKMHSTVHLTPVYTNKRGGKLSYKSIHHITFIHFTWKQTLRFPSHQISCVSDWVIEWVIEYVIFLPGLAQQWRLRKNQIWHKGSLGDEDDARTLNRCIARRKRTIARLTMKNNRNIIECCNNTHQGAPRACKQTNVEYMHSTCILQRKHAIPHSTMKNMTCVTETEMSKRQKYDWQHI